MTGGEGRVGSRADSSVLAVCVAHMSPRMMLLTAEKAVAAAVSEGRTMVLESDVWAEVRLGDEGPRLH